MPGRVKPQQQHGVLVLDKPSGPTSAGCLNDIKHRLGQKKIGHAGTLDPLARGVLVVLLGRATKVATFLLGGEKVYLGTLRLGTTTDTYDIQGAVTSESPWEQVAPEDVERAVAGLVGRQDQEVPAYSAAKHQGKPLYELARRGMMTPVKTKEVEISDARVVSMDLPSVRFRVRVSSGAYVRSLVHSLGQRLGCGAVMTDLVREYSHPFHLDQAHGLADVLAEPERLPERLLPLAAALPDWPEVRFGAEDAAKVARGMRLPAAGAAPGDRVLLLGPGDDPLAAAQAVDTDGAMRWAIVRGLG
jgi:tRNA pseudouridine55 synthase